MKKLLLLLMCVLTAVGMRAANVNSLELLQADPIDITGIVTYSDSPMLLHEAEPTDNYVYWYGNDGTNAVSLPGGEVTINLANHTGDLSAILNAAMQRADYYNKVKITGHLNADDVAALQLVDAKTLDLSHATFDDITDLESVVNTKVKFLALPENQTRDDVYQTQEVDTGDSWRVVTMTSDEYKISEGIVNGESLRGFSSLYSAFSTSGTTSSGIHVTAYNGKAGTLQAAIVASGNFSPYFDGSNARNGRQYYYSQLGTASGITLSGEANAFDICRGNDNGYNKLDENGHLAWDSTADESNAGADTRTRVGTTIIGPLNAYTVNLDVIDFEKAIFRTNSDMTISNSGVGIESDHLTKLVIPTSPLVTEIPAYFSGATAGRGVLEICIPSNIEIIRTHALRTVFHIWTTAHEGDIESTIYDNGVYDYDNDKMLYGITGVGKEDMSSDDANMPRYGTSFTFSSNLKLIESHAFDDSRSNVKDVYVLSTTAPECHVDAFSTQMYFGINGFGNKVVDGIIARESYVNSGKWITMLHFPRDTKTPNIQRYTDPTRNYSIASTLVDSRGNTIYLPTQSEFNAAYKQGTTGYLWGAWDPTLQWGMMRNGIDANMEGGWTDENQKSANDYVSGAVAGQAGWKNKADLANNPDVSFYDLTLNTNSQPAGVTPYYNVEWEGQKLYPAPTLDYIYDVAENGTYYYNTTTGKYEEWTAGAGEVTRYNRRTIQVATGTYTTDCEDAQYVRDVNYVENSEGTHVRTMNIEGPIAGGLYVQDFEWSPAEYDATYNGTYYFEDKGYRQVDGGEFVRVPDQIDQVEWSEYVENDPSYVINNGGYWQAYSYHQGQGYTLYKVISWKYEEFTNQWGQPRYNYYDNGYQVVTDPANATVQLYIKNYLGTYHEATSSDAADEPRYNINWGEYAIYDSNTNYGTYGTDYLRYNEEYTYHVYQEGVDDPNAQRYCPEYETVEAQQVVKKNDYRGWHQFVLTGYADPTEDIIVNHRSYITDNDWWTICLPYDLNYKEMMLFYGDAKNNKVPYLALLTNVVRDLGEQTITLNFSENLMTHKAYRQNGVWTVTNDQPSQDGSAGNGQTVNTEDNDIVLHAGVPYLIRPYRSDDGQGNFSTQFDIYGQANVNASLSGNRVTANNVDYPLLYNKMHNAMELGSYDAMALVEKGIYTVPGLVKNNDNRAEGVTQESVQSTTMDVKINGAIETLPISNDFDYSFVGNLYYNSFLPQNSYFLGWYNKARFFYADYELKDVTDMSDKNYKFVNVRLWNNNTCIICPNLLKSSKYHSSNGGETANPETQTYMLGNGNYYGLVSPGQQSSQGTNPAQWLIGREHGSTGSGSGALVNDWFGGSGSQPQHSATANPALMDFGVTNMAELTGIEELKTEVKTIPAINDNKVYTIDGRYVGESLSGLSKGLYIMNGKKVVVK